MKARKKIVSNSVMRLIIAIALFISIAIIQNPVYAQDSTLINLTKYQAQKKNPLTPLTMSAILPGLGQFYNHEIKKGIGFLGIALVCGMIATIEEKETENPVYGDGLFESQNKERPYEDVGFILFLTITIFSAIDAYKTVKKRNDALKKKYGIDLSLKKGRIGLNLALNFSR